MQKQHYVAVLFNEPQRLDLDGPPRNRVEYTDAGFTFDENDRLHIFRRGVGTIASFRGAIVDVVVTEEAS